VLGLPFAEVDLVPELAFSTYLGIAAAVPLFWSHSALAQVEYAPLAQCPLQATVEARADLRDDAKLELAIEEIAGEFQGKVTLTTRSAGAAEGVPLVRTLRGASCAEVVDALLLVTALELDHRRDARAVAPAPNPIVVPPPSRVTDVTRATTYFGGLSSGISFGLTPRPAAEFGVVLGVRNESREEASLLAPQLRIGVHATIPNHAFLVAAGTPIGAAFSSVRGSVELCPIRLRAGSWLATPCIVQDIGLHIGSPTDFTGALSSIRVYGATGVALAALLQPRALGGVFVGAHLSARASWAPLQYQLAGTEVYRTGPVHASAALLLGYGAQ
jgi:hypothetical protein